MTVHRIEVRQLVIMDPPTVVTTTRVDYGGGWVDGNVVRLEGDQAVAFLTETITAMVFCPTAQEVGIEAVAGGTRDGEDP